MEENMKTESNALLRTSPISPTMHNNVLQSRMKTNPTDTTLFTHSNLHSEYPSGVHLTHTTMPAIEWLKLRKLRSKRKLSIGKFEMWNTSHTQAICSWKLSKAGKAYARCSTNPNPSRQMFEIIG